MLVYARHNGICRVGCGHSPTVPCNLGIVRHFLRISCNTDESSAPPLPFLLQCEYASFVNPASTYYIGTCLCFINIQFVGFEAFRVLIRVMKEVMRFLASFIDMNLSLLAAPVQCFTIAASGWNWNLIPMPKPSGMISVLHIFHLLFYKPYCRRQ